MTSRNNCEVSAQPGPREQSSDSTPLTLRGRKRDRSVLTTTVGGSVCRDQSKDFLIDFKKPRCSSPVGGSGRRDRSKSLIITFKKPRLPKRKLRAKKVPSKGDAPPAANVTTPTSSLAPPTPSMAPPTPSSIPPTPSSAPPEVRSKAMWTKEIHHSFHLGCSWPVFLSISWNGGLCSQQCSSLRDEWSREQDSEEHLQKQQDLSSLFRDTEESGELWRMDLRLTMEHDRNRLEELLKKILSRLSECLDEGKVKQRIVQLLRRDEWSRQQDSEEHLQKQQDLSSLFRDTEESGELMRDEWSREQDSEEHLQKQQDLSSLFRDMEESGVLWRIDETLEHAMNRLAEFEKKILSQRSESGLDEGKVKQRIVQLLRRTEEGVWRFQRSTSLREDVDKAVGHFLVWGDEARLRKERQRLYRFQELLEQWSEAFTRGKHGVSFRVGECLKDVLAEVHEAISSLSWVESVQRSESGDERSREQDSEEHLQKQQDLNSLFRDMEESGVLRSFGGAVAQDKFPFGDNKVYLTLPYLTLRKLHGRSFENFIQMGGSADQKTEDPTGVSSLYHTGRFCQSSSGKTRRSLSVRNTRKYLRRLHTRTAGGALRRGPQPDCKLESRLSGSQ